MTINIRNKYDIPYGVLSIDYEDNFILNNKQRKSILDYICTIDDRNFKIDYPFNLNDVWNILIEEKINIAIEKGVDAKASTDTKFEGVLMSSETKPILYISEDDYLGANFATKIGQNVYGKFLTKYRNEIMDTNPEMYYNVYILNRYLNVAINYESLENYLEKAREGSGVRNLILILKQKYEQMVDLPSKAIIEQTRAFTKKEISYNTEEIILNVMKTKIRNVRTKNLNIFKSYIFERFVKNVIKKYNLDYDEKTFIKNMESSERTYSIDRVFEGYTKEVLSGEIQEIKPKIYIPSMEEVKEIESFTIAGIQDKIPETQSWAIVDSETSVLSLKDDRFVFSVDNRHYPTLSHYIMYEIGSLIPNFDAYNIVLNKNNNSFYTLNDTRNYLYQSLNIYKDEIYQYKIREAFYAKVQQKKYLQEFVKSTANQDIKFLFHDSSLYTELIRDYKNTITWTEVMQERGNVADYIDTDHFFLFVQEEMFISFLNTLNIATPGMYSYENVQNVYRQFFGNIPGTMSYEQTAFDFTNLKDLNKSIGNVLNNLSLKFLKNKFVGRILNAEELAKKLFNTNIIFMTKFLMLESRYRMSMGGFVDPKAVYPTYKSKEYLALAKVCNAIAVCNNYKIITKEHIDRAFDILNNTKKYSYEKKPIKIGKSVDDLLIKNYNENLEEDIFEDTEQQADVEEDETEDEKEVTGYETEEDDEFDDLMYANEMNTKNADTMSAYIFSTLNIPNNLKKYVDMKAHELFSSTTKSNFKIHLYQ